MPVAALKPIRAASASKKEQCNDQYTSSEDACSLWEYLNIGWVQPVLDLSSKRELMEEDMCEPRSAMLNDSTVYANICIGQMSPYLLSETVYRNFVARRKLTSLLKALIADNLLDLFLHISLGMLKVTLEFLTPIAFSKLLQQLANPSAGNLRAAFGYSGLMLFGKVGFAQCEIIRKITKHAIWSQTDHSIQTCITGDERLFEFDQL